MPPLWNLFQPFTKNDYSHHLLYIVFEINEDTLTFLRELNEPIGVISVAGMYRTGKSYLLNRVLLNQSRGFDVGPTINACTKVSNLGEILLAAFYLLIQNINSYF